MDSDPSDGTHTCTCPGCETRFRVTDDQLAVANGRVRCGACLTVFDCSDLIARPGPEGGAPDIAPAIVPGARASRPAKGQVRRRNTSGTQAHADASTSVPVSLFATIYAAAAIILVGLVLGLMFPSWSQQPMLRGVYQAACAIVPCEVPPLRALNAIAVKPLPAERRSGPPPTLSVPVELLNQAPFPQPFPDLAVRIVSSDGRDLGGDRMAPKDYLPRGQSLKMAPDKPVTIELQLEDAGGEAARYVLSAL